MRKFCLVLIFSLSTLLLQALTQQGYVRTISRPNHPSERLEGVLIRIRGGHNAIVSESNGDFSIVLQNLQNGDAYALSAVMKSGYQLSEQEMIGRQQSGSDHVPLELTMVSLQQLQEEKNAIATKARAGVEQYYMQQLQELEQAVSDQRLTSEQYELRIAELDDKLMRSEEQIEKMADRYARTDYALLDSMAGAIQQAIEQGHLDVAERLIMQKGALGDRQQRILDMRRDLVAETRDLKQDYYHMHSIALSRFMSDSAAYYLRLRAELDTTDAAAQLDYAKFLNEYQRSREEAYLYTQRAYRHVLRTDGERSFLMMRVLNEKGQYLCQTRKYDEAVLTYIQALNLSIELQGKEHKYTAGRRVCLGAAYYGANKFKDAKKQLNEAIRIYHLAGQEDAVSEANALNNLGAIAFAEKDYKSCRTYFERSVALLRESSPNNSTLPQSLTNLAVVCSLAGDEAAAKQYYVEAYDTAYRILGERHRLTLSLKQVLQKNNIDI